MLNDGFNLRTTKIEALKRIEIILMPHKMSPNLIQSSFADKWSGKFDDNRPIGLVYGTTYALFGGIPRSFCVEIKR